MSFTIKCDKCGKEQKLITKEKFDDENIHVFAEPTHEAGMSNISITCGCGNEVYNTHPNHVY